MSLKLLNDKVKILFPYKRIPVFRTLTTKHEDGSLQTKSVNEIPTWKWELKVKATDENIERLFNFYLNMAGAAKPFLFMDIRDYKVNNQVIAEADGLSSVYQLNKRYYSDEDFITVDKKYIIDDSEKIFIDDIFQTRDLDYFIDETGKINLTSIPVEKSIIKADFQFYYLVHFAADSLNLEELSQMNAEGSIVIEEYL